MALTRRVQREINRSIYILHIIRIFKEESNLNKVRIYFAYWTESWTGDYKYYVDKVARLGFDVLEVQPDQLLNTPRAELDSLR